MCIDSTGEYRKGANLYHKLLFMYSVPIKSCSSMCANTRSEYAVGNKRTILRDNNAIDWVISISTYSLIALIIIIIFTFALAHFFRRKFNCKFVVFCFNIKNVHNIRSSWNCRMNDNWTQKFNYNLPSSRHERKNHSKIN